MPVAQPALHKCCNNPCIAGLPHDTAVRWAAITNVQEMGFGCGVTFLSLLMIREMCSWGRVLVSSSVLMWQLLDALVFFFAEGVGPGMPILRTQAKI